MFDPNCPKHGKLIAAVYLASIGNAQNVPPNGPPQFPPGIIYEDLHLVPAFAKAHGLVMGIAFAILFPAGAILLRMIRSKYGFYTHIACQLLAYALMIAGLATGIQVGKILDRVCCYCVRGLLSFLNPARADELTS